MKMCRYESKFFVKSVAPLFATVAFMLAFFGGDLRLAAQNTSLASDTTESELTDGLRLSIACPDTEVRQLEPIRLKVTLYNTTSEEVQLPSLDEPNSAFQIEVTNQSGLDQPLTKFGQYAVGGLGQAHFRTVMDSLEPGQSETAVMAVNLLYDMTVPGKYVIRVKHKVFNHDDRRKQDVAISSPITVEVDPSQWAMQKMTYATRE